MESFFLLKPRCTEKQQRNLWIQLYKILILHVLLFIVLYWCDMYLCTSIVIQCLFQWIGRQVTCPHETDLSNKVLIYPENFWSSIVSYAPYQRVEHCLSGTWIKTLLYTSSNRVEHSTSDHSTINNGQDILRVLHQKHTDSKQTVLPKVPNC